ncbi:tryptophan--tRNA ligase [Dissulfurirhabdus thermomarina]|uniref:Tryptophan--tRNA ligase n=2 Tax=Dissulfurirhabdus thermomarina TaxID=1765737 RepID=A0A6N9TK18_DISTH|nr:tryptophan--tRNA ligase [Dissulfurirhabdus thermomarina]NMX24417.1 tryptophan--tRNA ligase [Dissulfurirhabdus thermomarina]
MRPTGRLHLGHLHGVLQNWLRLQEAYECFFCAADWHALTTCYESPGGIPADTEEMVLDWLAVGIDPERATVFVQSDVKEHAELHLLLSMITPVSWLERNPTYKEQQQELKERDLATYGFLGYPVLQAADIIIYRAHKVPVGVDQLPHVELTREITRRFNYLYGETFPVPEAMLAEVAKLPGLDGRKMSKSYGNAIFLSDTPDEVRRKIATMITDIERPRKSDPGDPENRCVAFNLHRLYVAPDRRREIVEACKAATLGCVPCKKELAEAVVRALAPIWERRTALGDDREGLHRLLRRGAERARDEARATMEQVRSALWSPSARSG